MPTIKITVDDKFLKNIDPMGQLKGMKPIRITKQDFMGAQVVFKGELGEYRTVMIPNSKVKVEK